MRYLFLIVTLFFSSVTQAATATLFSDGFEEGLSKWESYGSAYNGTGTHTSYTGSYSLYLHGEYNYVKTYSINALEASSLTLTLRVARGSSSFSDSPNSGEDLQLRYRNSSGGWPLFKTFYASSASSSFTYYTYTFPSDAYSGDFKISITLTSGSGSGSDYWHVDDVKITANMSLCSNNALSDNFESGLSQWSRSSSSRVGTGTHISSSGSQSLYLQGGYSYVTTDAVDLSTTSKSSIEFDMVRGDNSFSNHPESGDDLRVSYLNSSGSWEVLELHDGLPSSHSHSFGLYRYVLPSNALHDGFKLRFTLTNASSSGDYWHIDDVYIKTCAVANPSPVSQWHFDETSWNGTSGEVVDETGNINGRARNGANTVTNGKICGAADLDGVNDYIQVSGISNTLNGNASLSFWMKTSQSGTNTSYAAPGIAGVEVAGNPGDLFWGYINGSGKASIGSNPHTTAEHAFSSTTVNNNTWRHVVLTRNAGSGEYRVYVNGVLEDSEFDTLFETPASYNDLGRIYDQGGSHEYYDGLLDEVLIFDQVLTNAQVQSIYNNQQAGNNWDGTSRACPSSTPPAPVAQWHFDEASWNGTSGEVVDQAGNINGRARNGVNTITEGYICGAADFDGVNDYIQVTGIDSYLTTTASLSFWIKTSQQGTFSSWDAPGIAGAIPFNGDDILWGWLNEGKISFTKRFDEVTSSVTVSNNNWRHIVLVREAVTDKLWVYVDGVQRGYTQSTFVESISASFSSLGRIHDWFNNSDTYYDGLLDEVLIFDEALSSTEVQSIYNNQQAGNNWDGSTRTCPVTEPDHFLISHDGSAAYCLSESVSVTARYADNTTVTDYTGTITLDTQRNKGNWSLSSGDGSFSDSTANDGLATYTFASSDNGSASFLLYYFKGNKNVDVDAFDGSIRDDDSEGTLKFFPTGFSITANALANPPSTPINDPIANQQAAVSFPVHIAAYGTDPDSGQCGIIETYSGSKTLTLSTHYVDPTSGTLSASGAGSLSFSSGQASTSVRYDDVGKIYLGVSDGSISGQSNPFVVAPTDFAISVSGNPATTSGGSGFISAGSNFTATIEARNALGATTPNYGNEQSPENVSVSFHSLVFPAGGDNGSLVNGSSFSKVGSNQFQNTTLSWSEVGSVRLQAQVADGDYLGAGNTLSTSSDVIGRFYPENLNLSGQSLNGACTNFTYLSEPALSVAYQITAVNSSGGTTSNYDATLGYPVASVAYALENNDDGSDLVSRFSASTSSWSSGVYSVNDNSARLNRGSSREAPLLSVRIGVRATDIDSRTLSSLDMNATTSGDCSLAANCDAASLGTTEFYYGRLRLQDAHGPESAALPVVFVTEYWDGQQFVHHDNDSCTQIPRGAITFAGQAISTSGDLSVDLSGGTTTASFLSLSASDVTMTAGDAGLVFSAPGPSIAVTSFGIDVDMAALSWLRADWDQDGDDNNDTSLPQALVRFQSYRGHDRVLYWRHGYLP